MKSIKEFPNPLTCEEEKICLEAARRGNRFAREKLIMHNLRLITHVLKKYMLSDYEQEEFISIGAIGLIKAIDSFDNKKGIRLATYATRCIENEILMTLRSNKKLQREVYLNDPIGQDKEGNEIQLFDILVSEEAAPGEGLMLTEDIELLNESMIQALNKRELEIIKLRYGLYGREFTQIEISKMFNISRSYVSRIEKRAIEKIKYYFDRYPNISVRKKTED